MAVKKRKTGIYLPLKIILLVNRLKGRVSGLSAKPSTLGSEACRCLSLDSKASRSLQKGLGQSHLQLGGIPSNRHGIRKNGKTSSGRLRHRSYSGHGVQHILQSLDSDSKISPTNALSAVCSDDELFLSRGQSSFGALSLNEVVQALLVVSEAINVLDAARTQFDVCFIIAQAAEVGLNIDETFIANYEHLLLRLQSDLIEALLSKATEALILNDLDKTQRKLLTWFSEFPGCQRPLSTTWPWSIKPSLAVIWGVCWMFMAYDSQRQNADRIPKEILLQDEQVAAAWPVPQSNEYLNYGRENLQALGIHTQSTAPQRAGPAGSPIRNDCHYAPGSSRDAAQPQIRQNGQCYEGNLGEANATHGHAQHTYSYNTNVLDFPTTPGNTIATPQNIIAFPQQFEFDYANTWYTQPAQHLPRGGHLINANPTITVTDGSAQPHADFSSPYLQHQPQPQTLQLNTQISSFGNSQYAMGGSPHLEPSTIQTPIIRHERTPPHHSNSNMPTPVSIAASRSPHLSPVGEDGRSLVSSPRQLPPPSESGSSPDEDDGELSSRRNSHQYRRSGDPLKNEIGKLLCEYKDCKDLAFDRKCEWSKHMDKHDRPYKCKAVGCEKLRGFTYSGGLLRHEREVHKLHGGTKKSLFCPIDTCKRSTGSGFTRKENLHEHIRRVHRGNSADLGNMLLGESQDDTRLPFKPPFQAKSDYQELDSGAKRKRSSVAGDGPLTDLVAQNEQLRRENNEQQATIQELLARIATLERGQR